MEEYRILLTSSNVSIYVQQFMALKVDSEMEAILICAISKERIKIPIRHKGFINIKCIFELESWLEFAQSQGLEQIRECLGCRSNVSFTDYGVDQALCNAIAMLHHIDPEGKKFRRDKMTTRYSQHKFYGISKQDPTNKILLPGCQAILSVQRRQQQSAQVQLNKNNRNAYEEISRTIEKLEQFQKKQKFIAITKNYKDLNIVNQKLQSRAKEVQQVISKNCKLIEVGRESITANDFLFALKKQKNENTLSSILVIYYPHYNIWLDFELFNSNGQPYLQQEQALYIKNSPNTDHNVLYILGGKTSQFEQSAQFMQIKIPKDPYTQLTQLTLEKLPDLLQTGYNYLGTFYENKIFIFYGQKRFVNDQNCITDSMLNVAQVFNNQTWSNLQVQPIPRFDGSYFSIDHAKIGKCIVFYGGVADQPDGLPNSACKYQNLGQIFICKQQSFYGGPKSNFNLKFPQIKAGSRQDRIVCSPIFSIPYYKSKQLLISGYYLKENLNGKRQIYTLDWEAGDVKLNEIFSLEPPEQILTPYTNKVLTGLETFTPVQDCEGCIINGNFYTIHQFEQQTIDRQKHSITQLLKINQTNGQFKILTYQDRANTQEKNKIRISNLTRQNNIVMEIKM